MSLIWACIGEEMEGGMFERTAKQNKIKLIVLDQYLMFWPKYNNGQKRQNETTIAKQQFPQHGEYAKIPPYHKDNVVVHVVEYNKDYSNIYTCMHACM